MSSRSRRDKREASAYVDGQSSTCAVVDGPLEDNLPVPGNTDQSRNYSCSRTGADDDSSDTTATSRQKKPKRTRISMAPAGISMDEGKEGQELITVRHVFIGAVESGNGSSSSISAIAAAAPTGAVADSVEPDTFVKNSCDTGRTRSRKAHAVDGAYVYKGTGLGSGADAVRAERIRWTKAMVSWAVERRGEERIGEV